MQNSNLKIRLYKDTDYDSCVRIFKSNVPKYFDATEVPEFEVFLKTYATESFWIAEQNNVQVGCGGIRIRPDGSGGLCYGMVENSLHKHGVGRALTNFRLLQLLNTSGLTDITLDTSQHTSPFYERFGFQLTSVQKDFYGVGLDCHIMNLIVPQNPLELQRLRTAFGEDKNRDNDFTSYLQPPPP